MPRQEPIDINPHKRVNFRENAIATLWFKSIENNHQTKPVTPKIARYTHVIFSLVTLSNHNKASLIDTYVVDVESVSR